MTLKEVKCDVQEIQRLAEVGDHEGAHRLEDILYRNVLEEVVDQAMNRDDPLVRMVLLALRTQEIKFSRHCA